MNDKGHQRAGDFARDKSIIRVEKITRRKGICSRSVLYYLCLLVPSFTTGLFGIYCVSTGFLSLAERTTRNVDLV